MSSNYLANLVDQFILYADAQASKAELMHAHDEMHEECFRRLNQPHDMQHTEQSLFYHCAASYCAHVLYRIARTGGLVPPDDNNTVGGA